MEEIEKLVESLARAETQSEVVRQALRLLTAVEKLGEAQPGEGVDEQGPS